MFHPGLKWDIHIEIHIHVGQYVVQFLSHLFSLQHIPVLSSFLFPNLPFLSVSCLYPYPSIHPSIHLSIPIPFTNSSVCLTYCAMKRSWKRWRSRVGRRVGKWLGGNKNNPFTTTGGNWVIASLHFLPVFALFSYFSLLFSPLCIFFSDFHRLSPWMCCTWNVLLAFKWE